MIRGLESSYDEGPASAGLSFCTMLLYYFLIPDSRISG
jgi:hypothetical protein